jgi:cyclopropane-fatty-acyl-phospholipid synthase
VLTTTILEAFFARIPRRPFTLELWDGRRFDPTAGEDSLFTLRVCTPDALNALCFRPSMLSLAELYVSGQVDVEGDLEAAIPVADVVMRLKPDALTFVRLALASVSRRHASLAKYRAQITSRPDALTQRHEQAVRFHYELPTEFFALWLDSSLTYSCAYFRDDATDLERAQREKRDLICRKLNLTRGDRFLDLGCGWGGLLLHASEHYGVRASGVTLSRTQAAHVTAEIQRRGLTGSASVQVGDLMTFRDSQPFDKISSVGAIEHISERDLGAYFRHVNKLLSPGGLFMNQGICYAPTIGLRTGPSFFGNHVFPDGSLVPYNVVVREAERSGFEVFDAECLREHYALTLTAWSKGLEKHRDAVIRATDERTFRVFKLYFAGAIADFRSGRNTVYQTVFRLPLRCGSDAPFLRESWYRHPAIR